MTLFLDIHALQTVPPNNINRDDTGSPKSALFGGVARQRVSSQAWKRAIRKDFTNYLDAEDLGTRTKRVVERIARRAVALSAPGTPEDQISAETHLEQLQTFAERTETLLKAAGFKPEKKAKKSKDASASEQLEALFAESSYLMFLSDRQITNAATAVVEADESTKWSKKEAAALLDDSHSVDIAMFGRMLADATDFNVDASVQVAHALGVSASEPEFDYFTAVDDEVEAAEETGAGMIGTVAFTSSTLYRYANVNLDALAENLGGQEPTRAAALAFVQSFMTSMPSGKVNSFANGTLPDVVLISLREDRPISYVNAFEEPVVAGASGGQRLEAARKLADHAREIAEVYDLEPRRTWVLATASLADAFDGVGERVSRRDLLDQLSAELGDAQ